MAHRYALLRRTEYVEGIHTRVSYHVYGKQSLHYTMAKAKPFIRPAEDGRIVIKYEVLCDDQPKKVLLTMLDLTNKEEER